MAGRIAVLFEYPTLNGGERSMLQCFEQIDPGEFDVVAVAPGCGKLADELQRLKIAVRPFSWRAESGEKLPREELRQNMLRAIQEITPCLVHSNSLSLGRLTGSLRSSLEVPCCSHIRDIIRLSASAVADLNKNESLIAVSAATRRFHVAQGVDAERTQVIHNGVNLARFCRPATGAGIRQELKLNDKSFVMVTIGQIGLRKGQDILAAAASRVVDRVAGAHFLVVGERNSEKAESIEFERRLGTVFSEAGLSSRLHRLGVRDDVPAILGQSDLLVHPAKQEPLGRVLLESAAAGTPIVATAVGGTDEILTDGVSARLVPPGDSDALADGIIELAHDPAKRQLFAAAARDRVAQTFTAAIAAENLFRHWRTFAT